MLTTSLFQGTEKIQEKLVSNVPQSPPRARRLVMLVVIHDADSDARLEDPRVMLYQEINDPACFWIRKETPGGENGRTNYAESNCEDTITALGGFESSVRLMLDRLLSRHSATRLDQAATTMEKVMHSEASVRSTIARS